MDVLAVVNNNRVAFTLACVAAVAMVLVSEASYRESIGKLDELSAMVTIRSDIRDLQEKFLDAETGQRGYLLTGKPEFLQPYDEGIQRIDASLSSLQTYYAGVPDVARSLTELRAVSQAKLDEMALSVRLYQQGHQDAAKALVASGAGRVQMNRIRALDEALLEHLKASFERDRSSVYRTLERSRLGLALLSAIGLLALFMYLRQTVTLKLQQQELKRVVQAERDRLELEVAQRTSELRDLTRYLLTAREDERNRLARNLHDDLGSLLTSAKLDAARIKSRLRDKSPEALELLGHLVHTLNDGIALGRRIIEDLRPSALSNLGLVETLSIAAREFAQSTGIVAQCELDPVPLDPQAELMVFRLVQEALTNISKYAGAKHVWLSLHARERAIHISVRDDGVGFDTRVKPRSAYGLMGMRFRVEAEGGSLTVTSSPGQGTRILATLALTQCDPAAGVALP